MSGDREVAEGTEELRARAGRLLGEDNWRGAADLFSRAADAAKTQLGAVHGADAKRQCILSLTLAMSGRGKALALMGKARGKLAARPEILKAAVADARAAVKLARHSGGGADIAVAVGCLRDVLLAAGPSEDAKSAVKAEVAEGPDCHEMQALLGTSDQIALAAQMDAEADDGRSPGTFRWPRQTHFPALPTVAEGSLPSLPVAAISDAGWEPFLRARGGDALVAAARSTPQLLDALSFPLSLAWVLREGHGARWPSQRVNAGGVDRTLHVVVLGATARAEVRIWTESVYWLELEQCLDFSCRVRFHFVGPEVDPLFEEPYCVHRVAPPCAKKFLAARPELTPANTVCAVFNGGFGNFVASGREDLLWSWLPDLEFLVEQGFLCAFYCANDYADLKGEVAIHAALLGSRFVVAPRRNPFAMATVYTGEKQGGVASKEWFCGNSHVYVVCGCDPGSRTCAPVSSEDGRRRMIVAVMSTAAQLSSGELEVGKAEPPRLKPSADASAVAPPPPSTAAQQQTVAVTAASPAASAPAARSQAVVVHAAPAAAVAAAPAPVVLADAARVALAPAAARAEAAVPAVAAPSRSSCRSLEHQVSVGAADDDGVRWARFEVRLPGVDSIAALDLQISAQSVALGGFEGYVAFQEDWPEPVDEDRAKAAFSAQKGRLVIKAPCVGVSRMCLGRKGPFGSSVQGTQLQGHAL